MPDFIQARNKAAWNFIFTLFYAALVAAWILILYSQNKLPHSIPVFDFIIIGIATFRLTHLLVYDYITGYIREYFGKFETGPGRTIANLLSCPWCTGIWVALGVSFFYFITDIAWYVIFIIAVAGVGTFIEITASRIMRESH
jgi:uncharacterized membrane protein YhdT